MSQSPYENFIRCHAAVQTLLSKTLPCLQNAIDIWHHATREKIQSCSTPNQCQQRKKPSSKTNSCHGCIEWAKAIEDEVYPSYAIGSLQWSNANPTLFSKDPLEVVKLFVLRIPDNDKTYSTLGDFDPAGLLMIMTKFKDFHHGDESLVNKVLKVSHIRNCLAHLKLSDNLHLDDHTFGTFWKDISELVDALEGLGRTYFNHRTAQELRSKLSDIKVQSVQAKFEKEALRPLVEDMLLKILEDDELHHGKKNAVEDPDGSASEQKFIEHLAEDLRRFYRSSLCKKQLYPWKSAQHVNLDDIYTPITIDIEIPGARPIKDRLNSYEDIFRNDQDDRRFVLVGNPGQGKTTFCAKVAYDWSQEPDLSPLKHIKLLFIIQLGSLSNKSNVEEAIISQLLSYNVDTTRLGKIIRDLGKSVILVLDGLDEAPHDLLKPPYLGNIAKSMSFSDMRECRVLVTSRPWREHDITKFGVYKRLELQKMSKSDVKQYMEKFFNQNKDDYMTIALGKRLLKYINLNSLLVDASTPLVTLLICWYWIETNGKRRIPNRIYDLYNEIITIMMRSSPSHPVEEKEIILDELGQVAVEGLTQRKTKLVFKESELKTACTDEIVEIACAMGILCMKNYDGEKAMQFFHKSGQEFCSAVYLAHHLQKLSLYMERIDTVKGALSVAPVLIFGANSKSAAQIILEKLIAIFKSEIQPQISRYYCEKLQFDDTRPIQQFIELCLECNFEADGKADFTTITRDLFPGGEVLFYGIPSKTAISLAYHMIHCESDVLHHVKLRPVAHASDPFIFRGPTYEIYTTALQALNVIPEESIQEISRKFKAANPNLHESLQSRTPAQLAAYIQCIQASEDLPSASETNIAPIIESFQHIKLETLDVSNFKLNDQFVRILDSLENGYMQKLLRLHVRSVASTENQITRLVRSILNMPLLRELDISFNKAEAGETIPHLAKNMSKCTSLQDLYVDHMLAPADDMELLAKNIPPQLKSFSIHDNEMNDAVASCLADNLPKGLIELYISVYNLSLVKHNELMKSLHRTERLQLLYIKYSPYTADLIKHIGIAMPKWPNLHTLMLTATSKDLIDQPSLEKFMEGVQGARNLKKLHLYGISLSKEQFDKLVAVCTNKSIERLRFTRERLPKGVLPEELDEFVTLV